MSVIILLMKLFSSNLCLSVFVCNKIVFIDSFIYENLQIWQKKSFLRLYPGKKSFQILVVNIE